MIIDLAQSLVSLVLREVPSQHPLFIFIFPLVQVAIANFPNVVLNSEYQCWRGKEDLSTFTDLLWSAAVTLSKLKLVSRKDSCIPKCEKRLLHFTESADLH